MGIAHDMKAVAEDIVTSYHSRVNTLGNLFADTHKTMADTRTTLKEFASQREKTAKVQAEDLIDFVKNLRSNVDDMLTKFQKDHNEMTSNLKRMAKRLHKNLQKGDKDRLKEFKHMLDSIQKNVEDNKNYVADKLKEFHDMREDMGEEQKKELGMYMTGLKGSVKDLLGGYREDMNKMNELWAKLSAKPGNGDSKSKVEAEQILTTVKEYIKKNRKKIESENTSIPSTDETETVVETGFKPFSTDKNI